MTTTFVSSPSVESNEIDRSARLPLSLLFFKALAWLVIGGVLALLHTVQMLAPSFLDACPWLTFGRLQAMQETALVYGWATQAGLAVALWLLVRLGHNPLRGATYVVLGSLFWNSTVLFSLVGIAFGDMTSFTFLQMPPYVLPFMLVSFGVMATPGVLAWSGRRETGTYASQWYALAALFLFPWLFAAAQLMLIDAPARGVVQSVIGSWFAQNVLLLWLAPVMLGSLYYLVPKIKGAVIANYDFTKYGFWSLVLFGSWTGVRHLSGGPVPAWIPTVGIAAGILLAFHFLVVGLNLRTAAKADGSQVLGFLRFGLLGYLLFGLIEVVGAHRGLSVITQFTLFEKAHEQLFLAAFSLVVFASIYFIMPRLTGKEWASSRMIRMHYAASILGFALLVGGLLVGGFIQGLALNDASVAFADIAGRLKPWLILAVAGQALLLLGNLALFWNFSTTICCCRKSEPAAFEAPAALEVVSS